MHELLGELDRGVLQEGFRNRSSALMTVSEHAPNVESLMEEIEGYLCAIELFRAEGHEPRWRADPVAVAQARARSTGNKS